MIAISDELKIACRTVSDITHCMTKFLSNCPERNCWHSFNLIKNVVKNFLHFMIFCSDICSVASLPSTMPCAGPALTQQSLALETQQASGQKRSHAHALPFREGATQHREPICQSGLGLSLPSLAPLVANCNFNSKVHHKIIARIVPLLFPKSSFLLQNSWNT